MSFYADKGDFITSTNKLHIKKIILVSSLLLGFVFTCYGQLNFGCETASAFPKNTKQDIGIVLYTNDAETIWNAFRLATLSQSKGDTVMRRYANLPMGWAFSFILEGN